MEEILKSLPGPMQINETLFVIVVLFLVLLVILNNLIFKPIVAKLEERARRIDEGAEAEAHSLKTVEESMATLKKKRIEARADAQNQTHAILKASETEGNQIIAASREKAQNLVKATAKEVEDQVEKAKAALQKDTKSLADQIVATVLSRSAS
ncbi:F0F1 ATP synthase subunit B family protein [Acanthopleuribacter pedis]|uniref:ATP synthase subunit b n=1 Tax=Acanthopleuribacter pedis TaxID=442870 RepID=A0A8J7U2D8_9BACT|nr:hypothetical protein [Acanthopleuribacter pedis]MBO1317158.1 hypothetical protein [Acanthopleuribacter pedis]